MNVWSNPLELVAVFSFTTAALIGGLVWLLQKWLQQAEGSTLASCTRLVLQGSVKVKSWQLRGRLAVHGVSVSLPPHLGGHAVFTAAAISTDAPIWRICTGHSFELKVDEVCLDCLGDEDGLLHFVALLQDVRFWREAQAAQRPDNLSSPKSPAHPDMENRVVSRVNFASNIRVLTAHIQAENGTLLLPEDVGQIVGDHVSLTSVIGAHNMRSTPALDTRWVDHPPPSGPGRPPYPLAVDALTAHCHISMHAWRTADGLALAQPLRSQLDFTPALVQYGFARVHPLLRHAAELDSSDHVDCTLEARDGHLPAECLSLRLAPMKLKLATRGFIKVLMRLLRMREEEEGLGPKNELQAWTSEVQADYYREGLVVSKRMDILVGRRVQQGRGMQLCMWGKVDTSRGNAVSMTLGLPALTLRRMGITKAITDDYVLPVKITGVSHAPEVDLASATRQLGSLFLQQSVATNIPLFGSFLEARRVRKEAEGRNQKTIYQADVPLPVAELPWAALAQDRHTRSISSDEAEVVQPTGLEPSPTDVGSRTKQEDQHSADFNLEQEAPSERQLPTDFVSA